MSELSGLGVAAYPGFEPSIRPYPPDQENFLESRRRNPQQALLQEMPYIYKEKLGMEVGSARMLRGNFGNKLVLFDNVQRAAKYRARAREAADSPPPSNSRSLFSFPPQEYHSYLSGYDITAAVNVAPYTATSTIFIPGPARTPEGYMERPQHPSAFTRRDLKCMERMSERGMLMWWVGDVPTNQNLHFHGLRDRIRGERFPITDAVRHGRFDMNSGRLQIAQTKEGPVEYNSFLTDIPNAALAALQEVGQTDVRVNMIVTNGLFVITPVSRFKACFLDDPDNPCYWLPSSERAGFFMKQEDMSVAPDRVSFGPNTMTPDDFIIGFYRELADMGMPEDDVRNLFPAYLHTIK